MTAATPMPSTMPSTPPSAEPSTRPSIASSRGLLVVIAAASVFLFGQAIYFCRAVPQFEEMFSDMGTRLPPMTEFLLSATQPPFLILLPPIAFTLLGIHFARRRAEQRTWAAVVAMGFYFALGFPLVTIALFQPLLKIIETIG